LLLDSVLKKHLTEPFSKLPPDGTLPSLNKHIIKGRIGGLEAKISSMNLESTPTKENYDDDSPILQKKSAKASARESESGRRNFKNSDQENVNVTGSGVKSILKIPSKTGLEKGDVSLRKELHFREDDYRPMTGHSHKHSQNQNTLDNIILEKKQSRASPDSVRSNRSMNEIKEILKLKAELELAKLNEECLKNELDIKILSNNQAIRKYEKLNVDYQNVKDKNLTYVNFLKNLKKRIEDNQISFENRAIGENFVKELNTMCSMSEMSPVRRNLSMTFTDRSRLENKNDSKLGETRLDTSNLLNISNSSNTIISKKTTIEDRVNDELDQYLLRANSDITSKKVSRISKTSREPAHQKNGSLDKDTSEFLSYIDTFQRENERLKKETEDLLKRSSKMQTTYR